MKGKIALEEHFGIPETLGDSQVYARGGVTSSLEERLLDLQERRLAEMDEHGIAMSILSLNSPAVQAMHDVPRAIDTARRANDVLAAAVARHPDRFAAFAALPMQDPEAAAAEVSRAVTELGFKGALVNGFSQVGDPGTVAYYDHPSYLPFWARLAELDVPFYLHPREPLASREPVYEGHPWLMGPMWAFGAETAMHALRLMASGLFDRHPGLRIILGHLGEGLPYSIWRLDHCLARTPRGIPAKRPLGQYLRENFYLTTSGHFRTSSLAAAIAEVGVDRILFSVDYPFELTADATTWFDALDLPAADHRKIARENAAALFGLTSGD